MEYAKLGHSGIEVSRICIGGMSFGEPDAANHEWTIGSKETEAVIAYAFENGINYIDTANCYAHGTSEEYIGCALRKIGIPRDKVVLQSKVFFNEGVESPTLGFSKPERVDDAVAAIDIELSREEMDYLEEPYLAHELVGSIGRPGEKPIAGTIRPKAKEEVRKE